MQDTINFLISQNEQNKKASNKHMEAPNKKIDAIKATKKTQSNYRGFIFNRSS
jgi:hypothetical protein